MRRENARAILDEYPQLQIKYLTRIEGVANAKTEIAYQGKRHLPV